MMKEDLKRFIEESQRQIIDQARDLYSEKVVDRWLRPRNQRPMAHPDGYAQVLGPCGDSMEMFIRVSDRQISEISFLTDGCVTTIAAGSMATEMATGKPVLDAGAITKADILRELDGLPEESQHCAQLAEDCLKAALSDFLDSSRDTVKKP